MVRLAKKCGLIGTTPSSSSPTKKTHVTGRRTWEGRGRMQAWEERAAIGNAQLISALGAGLTLCGYLRNKSLKVGSK